MTATAFLDACGFIPASSGTGDFVVSAAVVGYQTPASAGAVNSAIYAYRAESVDKSQWECGFGAYTVSSTTLARTTVIANSSGNTSKISFSAAPNVYITGGAADVALATRTRWNDLLNLIYQSKWLASYRRGVNVFADGYKNSDGFVAGSSSGYVLDTTNGNIALASSAVRITGGTPTAPLGGTAANINDNNTGTTITVTPGNKTGASVAARIWAQIDYGSNQTITKMEAVNAAYSGSSDFASFYYSTDGTTWTQAGSGQTITPSAATVSVTGSWTARYIALVVQATGYSTQTFTVADLNGYAVPTSMSVVTTAQTADASISTGRILLEFDNTNTPTLNTDLTAELSCDGGSHWTSGTLAVVTSNGQGGRTVVETGIVACTAGTSFQARIKTLNSKTVAIYGTALMMGAN